MYDLSNTLTELRKEKGVTQQTIANHLGISQQTYARYESGTREPSIKFLVELSDYFKTSVDRLLGVVYKAVDPELNDIINQYDLGKHKHIETTKIAPAVVFEGIKTAITDKEHTSPISGKTITGKRARKDIKDSLIETIGFNSDDS